MLSFAYFAMLSGTDLPSITRILASVAIFLVSVFGIAGFGHVFTDMFDVTEDRIRGQANSWDNASAGGKIGLVVGLLAASVLPWFFLPGNSTVYLLLAAEFLAFAAYAVPPVRLKTRGLPGIAADSSYAHTLPSLWTWIPFALLSNAPTPLWAGLLIAVWAFSVGARELMLHQAIDAEIDRAGNVRTFGALHGRARLMKIIDTRIFPIEILAFTLLLGLAAVHAPVAAVGFVLYLTLSIWKAKQLWLSPVDLLAETSLEDRVTVECRRIMSPLYYGWLPLLLLLNLAMRDARFFLLGLLHLVLFSGMIFPLVKIEMEDVAALFRFRKSRSTRNDKAIA